jgi:hypothetical protein
MARVGVGQALLSELEARAGGLGYRQTWVATKNFCQRCGWQDAGQVDTVGEGPMTVLVTRLSAAVQQSAVATRPIG